MPPSIECGYANPGLLELQGPQVQVRIGFDAEYNPNKSKIPSLPEKVYNALIDTGAEESCVDASLAQALELPITDRKPVIGVHDIQSQNVYAGQILIPELPATITGTFIGANLHAAGLGYLALNGRDYLRGLRMVYDGPSGKVTLEKGS